MDAMVQTKLEFYYEQLDDIDEEYIYKKIAGAVSRYESEVQIDCEPHQLRRVMKAIKFDNPEIFYWFPEKSDYNEENGVLKLSYTTASAEETKELLEKLKAKKKEVLAEIRKIKETKKNEVTEDALDEIHNLYEYLLENVENAEEELEKPECARSIYDVTGVLLQEGKGRAACLGIALAVNYICSSLHIPSVLVTGKAKIDDCDYVESWAWNLVKVDGEYYHVDVAAALGLPKDKKYKYLLLDDEEMKELGEERKWSEEVYPKAGIKEE